VSNVLLSITRSTHSFVRQAVELDSVAIERGSMYSTMAGGSCLLITVDNFNDHFLFCSQDIWPSDHAR
jgi:hypothetical protein